MGSAKMRHCCNCGAQLGSYVDHDRYDTCGQIECDRAVRDMMREEREDAHERLDRDMGW